MNTLQTLMHPFEAGLLPLPVAGARGIVFNAQPGMRRPDGFRAELFLVQGFRPLFLRLERSGHEIAPQPQGDDYDLAFVIAGRHRRQNELWIAEALAGTRPGGTILVAGGKTDGTASLRKRAGELLPLADSASKHHGVVFWLERPADAGLVARAVEALTPAAELVEERYATAPGGFSAAGIDPGSRLLADSLPADLKGKVADFCAGWGYLATRLAERPAIASVDLFEADFASLEAARDNMARLAPGIAASFHWTDLASEPVAARYDSIVMNPPFHQGRAAEPDVGLAMIRAAHAALKAGGRLFLVANRGLPYEAQLSRQFKSSGEIVREGGFKVLWAAR
jgi:16S rRNA (guanine1207-N2)-methyltransferase